MHSFRYTAPTDATVATAELATPGALPVGGATDLLPRLRDGRTRARTLVDLRRVASGDIVRDDHGTLHIGAGATLAAIAADPLVRAHAAALGEAAAAVGTRQLRATGTLGGNLCQAPRCMYWRRGIACHRTERDAPCHAHGGESAHHGILGEAACPLAHPSDPAVALVALDARVSIGGPVPREIGVLDLLAPTDPLRDLTLASGEWVQAVRIPADAQGGVQRYTKVTQREAWEFALVSLAEVAPPSGPPRLVLGGVARHPWPVAAETVAAARGGASAPGLAAVALADARPLAGNAYKVTIARRLLEAAFARLGASAA